jgi:heptosyltransferase-1
MNLRFTYTAPMRVLLVKTSSLGDVIHALPAVTDAACAVPGLELDWLVEEAYADIPALHPAVRAVIPVALRRWRQAPLRADTRREYGVLRERLRCGRYDLVLDTQGLLKSAWLAGLAGAPAAGFDFNSAREPVAALLYRRRHAVAHGRHAIDRQRALFALALGYPCPADAPEHGLRPPAASSGAGGGITLLHGTAWPSKQWPEDHWCELARHLTAEGREVWLPQGSAEEEARAQRIAAAAGAGARVLPAMPVRELAGVLAGTAGVVAVDTGLAHLAAALNRPLVALYGATDPRLTGVRGPRQRALAVHFECAPCLQRDCRHTGAAPVQPACYASLPPRVVLAALHELMA